MALIIMIGTQRVMAEKLLLITATAMCSSGLRTINFKYRTNDDSRTNFE